MFTPMTDAPSTPPITPRELVRVAGWVVASACGVAALAVAASQVPERARLLLWFAIAFGLLAGCGAMWLVERFRVPFPRLITVLTAIIIAAGEFATSMLAHHRQVPELEEIIANRRDNKGPLAAAEKQFLEEPAGDDSPEARVAREQFRAEHERTARIRREWLAVREHRLTWRGYLQHRVSTIGAWPTPWPELLWLFEIAAGSAAGGWLANRAARRSFCHQCATWLEPTRSTILTGGAGRQVVEMLSAIPLETLPADARLHLRLLSCRCPEPTTEIMCDLERSGRLRPLRLAAQPTSNQLRHLFGLMTSHQTLDHSHCDHGQT